MKQLKESALKAKEPEAARIGEPPASLDTGTAAEDWLKSQIGTADPKINDFLKRFRDLAQSISKESFDRARARFTEVTDAFSKTRFQLMPDPYPWPSGGQWSWPFQHLLGILASAALLSLGAPFWFNTLKSLANLRPMLAKEIDKDPKQMPASK